MPLIVVPPPDQGLIEFLQRIGKTAREGAWRQSPLLQDEIQRVEEHPHIPWRLLRQFDPPQLRVATFDHDYRRRAGSGDRREFLLPLSAAFLSAIYGSSDRMIANSFNLTLESVRDPRKRGNEYWSALGAWPWATKPKGELPANQKWWESTVIRHKLTAWVLKTGIDNEAVRLKFDPEVLSRAADRLKLPEGYVSSVREQTVHDWNDQQARGYTAHGYGAVPAGLRPQPIAARSAPAVGSRFLETFERVVEEAVSPE